LRRGVDQDIKLKLTKPRPHLFRLPEIELRVIESGDLIVAGVFPRQGRAEAAARSHDDDALSRLHSIGFRRNRAPSSHRSWSKTCIGRATLRGAASAPQRLWLDGVSPYHGRSGPASGALALQ